MILVLPTSINNLTPLFVCVCILYICMNVIYVYVICVCGWVGVYTRAYICARVSGCMRPSVCMCACVGMCLCVCMCVNTRMCSCFSMAYRSKYHMYSCTCSIPFLLVKSDLGMNSKYPSILSSNLIMFIWTYEGHCWFKFDIPVAHKKCPCCWNFLPMGVIFLRKGALAQ